MILTAQSIRKLEGMIEPFVARSVDDASGKSYGLSSCGYDIRVDKFKPNHFSDTADCIRMFDGEFVLASSIERIKMPNNLVAIVHDKSSWAREGLAVQNTVLEPGWEGFITLELTFHRPSHHLVLRSGMPIAQIMFHQLDAETDQPYEGKYQNQPNEPVESIHEKATK